MYPVYRISQLFLQVEVWIFLCLLAALYLSVRRKFLLSRKILLLAVVLFYTASITPVAKLLMNPLESWYPPLLPKQTRPADAIVVLAGAFQQQPRLGSYTILGTQSLDRLICGIRFLQEGSAPLLVLTGGVADPFVQTPSVASAMKDQAIHLGVPSKAVLTETHSRTTAESAVEVRRQLPDAQRIVLITTAFHLPRAVALFRKQGFADVQPAPCFYEIAGDEFVLMDLIPNYNNMRLIDDAIHEYVGIAIYKVLGRL